MGSLGRRQNLTVLEICFPLTLPTGDEKLILTKAEVIFFVLQFSLEVCAGFERKKMKKASGKFPKAVEKFTFM